MAKKEKIQESQHDMNQELGAHKVNTQEMVKSMTATYRDMERGLLKTIA